MKCPHCDSSSVKEILHYQTRVTAVCQHCNGFFNNIQSETDNFYDRAYYERNYLSRRKHHRAEARDCLKLLKRFAPAGSILDYGCGTGAFLEAAREAGYTGNVGADVSRDALVIAKERVAPDDGLIHLPSEPLPKKRFEAITLMDSISHIRDLRGTLERLRDRNLARDGVLLIRTPDIPDSYFATVSILSRVIGKRTASNLLHARARHVLFNSETLRRYIESLGLEVLLLDHVRDYLAPLRSLSINQALRTLVIRALNARTRPMIVIARQRQLIT